VDHCIPLDARLHLLNEQLVEVVEVGEVGEIIVQILRGSPPAARFIRRAR